MKIHKDGTIEGTPEELAAYMRLQAGQQSFKFIGPPVPKTGEPYTLPNTIISTTDVDAGRYPGSDQGPYTLDGTKHPYGCPKVVFAYNGDQTADIKNAFTAMWERVVSKNTGCIS